MRNLELKTYTFCLIAIFVLFAPSFLYAEKFICGQYQVVVPDEWRKMDYGPSSPFDVFYVADGTFLPVMFNDGPVMVRAWIMSAEGTNLEEATDLTIQGYTQNPDRIFKKGFSHEKENLILKSGEDACIINTRFYRKEKGLNQSRFDLVAFPKGGIKGVVYTISIQYLDSTYEFEEKYELKKQVKRLFYSFRFR